MEEAENNSHSSNPEKAWEKMEFLLDEHLPVKKKRRRFIFLLFPLLLAAGVTLFFLQQNDNIDHSISRQKGSTTKNPVASSKNTGVSESSPEKPAINTNEPVTITNNNTKTVDQASQPNKPAINNNNLLVTDKNIIPEPGKKTVQKKPLQEAQTVERRPDIYSYQKQADASANRPIASKQDEAIAKSNDEKENDNPAVTGIDSNVIVKTSVANPPKTIADTITNKPIASAKKTPGKKSSFSKNLSFTFSFGPDISSVGIDKPGKPALPYGIGASYALSKKISIRTGFFVGRKIYDADSADYHPPSNFWNYYSNLKKIEANCLVYEIPVSVVYNFASAKKHNWFVSGGLSSYLMKKEAYDYYFKNSWGQPQLYHRTYKNKNSHILSVLNISGGYQYRLSDRVSVMAEPYVKVPVSGIGYGKVKLNSTGVLFTVSVKPFLKKN